jgi:hypothetical protein
MAWLSKFGRSFDPGDLHGSLGGIVTLFDPAHNISARDAWGLAEASANQMPVPDNEPCIGPVSDRAADCRRSGVFCKQHPLRQRSTSI